MTYICENCKFVFYRAGEVQLCPLCEQHTIRDATEDEATQLNASAEKNIT